MFASLTQPFYFEPVRYNNQEYFSGDIVWDLDIFSVVNECKRAGYAEQDIVVDVIMTTNTQMDHVDTKNYKVIAMLKRFKHIKSHYSMMDGILRARYGFPKVHFRNIIAPKDPLP